MAAALVIALALSSAAWGLGLPIQPLDTQVPGLDIARALVGAETWTDRILALSPYLAVKEAPALVTEMRTVPELVGSIYPHLGTTLTADDAATMETHLATLPADVVFALQQLLGAIELGFQDWHTATATVTMEEWARIGERGITDEDAAEDPIVAAALAKIDEAVVQASALRLIATVDLVTPILDRAIEDMEPAPRAAPFPGPNDGVLFNDPFNLILVGDVVTSTFWGNTWPFPSIRSTDHILILELGGDDMYRNHAATATYQPCELNPCGNGVPVSVVVDVQGEDLYWPADTGWNNLGYGAWGSVGVLIDLQGNDRYVATVSNSQARGFEKGIGILMDARGHDEYDGSNPRTGGYRPSLQGTAGGLGAVGILVDAQGNDRYSAGDWSQGRGSAGLGALIDFQGDDTLRANGQSQGAVSRGGAGILLNIGGHDSYSTPSDSRGWAGPCFDPNHFIDTPDCPPAVSDFIAVFVDVCGFDEYHAWLGADDSAWTQNLGGYGRDQRDPILCSGNE